MLPSSIGLINLTDRISELDKNHETTVIPNILSTYGIPQMLNKMDVSKRKIKMLNTSYNLSPLGLIVNKMVKNSGMHKRTLDDLKSRQNLPKNDSSYVPKLFKSTIFQSYS